jgi:hypothetical protein
MSISIDINNNEDRNNLIEIAKEDSEKLNRIKDKGIINQKSGAGFSLRDSGDVAMISSEYSQYHMSSSGITTETSLQSNLITNTRNLRLDNLAINRHRLNPALWELTDFKQINGSNDKVVGNLNMTGTVLVKAWEPSLNKYVLIRRPMRMPVFSTTLDIPDTPDIYEVEASIGKDLMEYLIKKFGDDNNLKEKE